MPQPFALYKIMQDPSCPALRSFAITPADGADLADYVRGIEIGTTAGVVAYHAWDGTVCTTGPLPVGKHPMLARRILATGTTATGITGWV